MANTKKYVSLDKLSLYDEKIKKVITDADAASLKSAKDYADSLATNYDKAGAAATAEANAKAYADGKDAAIAAAKKAGDDAAAAAGVADGKAVAAQSDVDALETYVGTIPSTATAKDIVGYVQEKTSGIATEGAMTELTARVDAVEDVADANAAVIGEFGTIYGVNTISGALQAAEQATMNLDTQMSTLGSVLGEGVDLSAGYGASAEIDTDDKTITGAINELHSELGDKADKSEVEETVGGLQEQITANANAITLLTNGVSADEVDGVNDLIQYVKDHGTEVTGMQEDIADNAEAIEGVAGRMTTAEGKITAVEGAVATKAEKSYVDEQVQALQGVDTGLDNRLKAIEGKFGEGDGNVAGMIATAKQEAMDYADEKVAELANGAVKTNTDAIANLKDVIGTDEELEQIDISVAGRVLINESDINSLKDYVGYYMGLPEGYSDLTTTVTDAFAKIDEKADASDLDAAVERIGANETAIGTLNTTVATKAAQADLTAATDRITAIENWHSNFVEVSEEEINALFTA